MLGNFNIGLEFINLPNRYIVFCGKSAKTDWFFHFNFFEIADKRQRHKRFFEKEYDAGHLVFLVENIFECFELLFFTEYNKIIRPLILVFLSDI